MSVHEDLLNNGENNCSFTEDEVDIMCSKDGDDACGINSCTTSDRYVKILDFRHFERFFSFRKIGENHKEKSLVKKVTVVVVLDLGTGNTKNLEYENE